MARYRSGEVRIDVGELIDQVDDKDIAEEFKRRKLDLGGPDVSEDVREAYEELLRNRPAEARAILERIVNPKWPSQSRCETDYTKARS